MRRISVLVITSVGSGLGWWLGMHIGIFTALVLCMIGTGVGMYIGRRLVQE